MRPQSRRGVKLKKRTRVSSRQVQPVARHSLRDGLRFTSRSPAVTGLVLPPLARADFANSTFTCKTPASGQLQDHTTSPSAASGHQTTRLRRPLSRSSRRRVHRIPRPVRDDRETPLWVGRDGGYSGDLGRREKRNIFAEGLDRVLVICPSGQSVARRMRFRHCRRCAPIHVVTPEAGTHGHRREVDYANAGEHASSHAARSYGSLLSRDDGSAMLLTAPPADRRNTRSSCGRSWRDSIRASLRNSRCLPRKARPS